MSLSSEVRNAFSKPHGMRDFSETHPVLTTLGAACGFLAAFILACRYLFLVL